MRPSAPAYIQLYPTTRCNQSCLFCFNESSRTDAELSPEKALRLLGILDREGISEVDIMGGEPLLVPWLLDFMRSAAKKGIRVNVSTNGSMPGLMERFADLSAPLPTVGVSLEGSTADRHNRLTGSLNFHQALASIRRLVSLHLDPVVKTVVCRTTMKDLQCIAGLLRGMGVGRYCLIHMDLLSAEPALAREALGFTDFSDVVTRIRESNPDMEISFVHASCFRKESLPAGVRCAGGVRKLSIQADGSVSPCNLLHGAPEFLLGNIFTDPFRDIWENPKLLYFRHGKATECERRDCRNHVNCTGGCPAHAIFHGRHEVAEDIRCDIARKRNTPI